MTKGDISGNSLIGAHFSCNSHGNTQFSAAKKCPRTSPSSQGWGDTSHHHQRCSRHSQRHRTSGCPCHKSRATVHVSEGAVLFQPTRSGAFYPPKVRITHGVSATIARTLGWSIFHSHLLMLGCWRRTSAAGVRAAVVRWDRRGHCLTFTSDSLFFFPTLGITRVKPLRGEGREKWERRAKGFHQHLLKESRCDQQSHFWEQLALLERRKKNRQKKKLIHYPKGFFFFSSFWVLKPVMLCRWAKISFFLLYPGLCQKLL